MTQSNDDYFNTRLDRIAESMAVSAQIIERLANVQESQHELFMAELRQMRDVAQEQSRTAQRQQETIRQFVTVVAEQARTIADMSRSVADSVNASRQASQAAETAAVIAQSNQEAIRDLINTMREER